MVSSKYMYVRKHSINSAGCVLIIIKKEVMNLRELCKRYMGESEMRKGCVNEVNTDFMYIIVKAS